MINIFKLLDDIVNQLKNINSIWSSKNPSSTKAIAIAIGISANCDSKGYFIKIQDDGVGVSKIMQQQLFAPFKRESRNAQDLGLGFAMTKNTVNLHKGIIQVRNLNQGFKVEVCLSIKPNS